MTLTVAEFVFATLEAHRILMAARGRRLRQLGAKSHAEGMRLVAKDAIAGLFHDAALHMAADLTKLDYVQLQGPARAVARRG